MKKLVKRMLDFVFNTKNERLILIGLPCVCILVSFIVLIPAFNSFYYGYINSKSINSPVVSDNIKPSVLYTSENTISTETPVLPTSEIQINKTDIHLTATSTENDLYIFVRDNVNNPVANESFSIIVNYPTGETGKFATQNDGSCYLVNLSSGTYKISIEEKDGYNSSESITCDVKDRVSYTYINDIEDIVDVAPISEVISEVKTNESEAPTEIVAEVVQAPLSVGSIPLLDNNGNNVYTYTWQEDAEGHLLDSNGIPTDVFPYYEVEGKLLWGFKLNGNATYEEVKLINDDNTPVSEYMISANIVYTDNDYGWKNLNGNVYYLLPDGSYATGLKTIDNQMYYFDNNGVRAKAIGVDVSFYNGSINWSAVKNSGIDFVIMRIGGRGWGTGVLYDDSCFYNYINGAKSAGLKVGAYFYSSATNRVEAVQEASIAIDRLKGISLDYPVYIDIEYSGDYPNGRSDTLSRAQRVEICTAFCETIKSSGYRPGIYSSESFLSEGLDYNSISSYNIWMASYTENNMLPSTSFRYDIWQISDRGRIPGINGNCDINIIR